MAGTRGRDQTSFCQAPAGKRRVRIRHPEITTVTEVTRVRGRQNKPLRKRFSAKKKVVRNSAPVYSTAHLGSRMAEKVSTCDTARFLRRLTNTPRCLRQQL